MEIDPDPWEALDTDLSSTTTPLLRRCTTQPRVSLLSPPPQQTPSTTTLRRLIPGPASAIQAAMHRKNRFDCNSNKPPSSEISTQEYIRRVEQDSGDEFRRNPWIFAIDLLRNQGVVDTTPLSAIKKCVNAERFNQVVAIVNSCTPNGLGDMMITLKDPADTLSASVHGKVLNMGEFGRLIAVGSVLVLQKVVAFSSSCMSCYLNITRSNVAKIISVDCEVQNFTEDNLHITPVFSRNSVIPENTSGLVSRRERVTGDVYQISTSKGKSNFLELSGNENYTQPSSLDRSRQLENAADKFFEAISFDQVDSCSKRQGDNSGRSSQPDNGSLEGRLRNPQDLNNDEVHKQVREYSSAPSIVENPGSRNQQASGAQVKSLLRGSNCNMSTTEKVNTASTSSRMPGNFDDVGICDVNDVQKLQSRGFSSAPSIVENLAKRNMSEIIGSLRSTQRTKTGDNINVVEKQDDHGLGEANGIKKQRLALVSKPAVQEWTDEQLCILDMDED